MTSLGMKSSITQHIGEEEEGDPAHHEHQEYSACCTVVIPDQWFAGSHVTVGSVTDELHSCVTAEKNRHHHQLIEIMERCCCC